MSESDLTPSTGLKKPVPGLPQDWHNLATEQIVDKVDLVRQKTAGPAIGAARMAVFGVMAAILGVMAAIVLIIGLVRLGGEVMPIWLTYVILGSLFVVVGLFLWSKRPKGVS